MEERRNAYRVLVEILAYKEELGNPTSRIILKWILRT